MADAKITDLLELTTQADDDVLAIVDISAGPATTKKITTAIKCGSIFLKLKFFMKRFCFKKQSK